MSVRTSLQLAEAFGPVNRWYCSQHYQREIQDPDTLLTYFVRSGGAKDFAERYIEAMGLVNRWYCSEYYGRDVREPEVLWDYYMRSRPVNRMVPRAMAC